MRVLRRKTEEQWSALSFTGTLTQLVCPLDYSHGEIRLDDFSCRRCDLTFDWDSEPYGGEFEIWFSEISEDHGIKTNVQIAIPDNAPLAAVLAVVEKYRQCRGF
jgi:hypothetical protein